MKIHRIYNELNEINDISKDKVVITMSASLFEELRINTWRVRQKIATEKSEKFFKEFEKLIKEADEKQTTEWAR